MDVRARVQGGAGGNVNFGLGNSGNGGAASATASGTTTGFANVRATATGGAGGTGGTNTRFGGVAFARASATGTSGNSIANANSSGGIVNSIVTTATAPAGGNNASVTEGRAGVAQPILSRSTASGLQAAGYGVGLPDSAAVQGAIAGAHPNVQAVFPANALTLGAVNLAVQSRSDAGNPNQVFDTSVAFTLNTMGVTTSQNLRVGLIDADLTGSVGGFQSLVFTIRETGMADKVFTFSGTQIAGMQTLADAQTFFHDNVINLGPLPASANLVVSFQLTLTSTGGGDGFDGNLVFGVVPEPSTWVMAFGGALALLGLTRLRLRRAG